MGERRVPGWAATTLGSTGLVPTEILVLNEWKQTLTIRARHEGNPVVAKLIGPSAPVPVALGFAREVTFYTSQAGDAPVATPVLLDRDLLVLTDVGGVSMRRALLQRLADPDPDAPRVVFDAALEMLRRWLAPTGGRVPQREAIAALGRIRSSLAWSGPMATASSRVARVRGRLLDRLSRPAFLAQFWFASSRCPDLLRSGRTHGDLHLDNVVVGENGTATLVDFATSGTTGPLYVDAMYLLAAAFTLASTAPHTRRDWEEVARERLDQDGHPGAWITWMACTLEDLARQNPRFNSRARDLTVWRHALAFPARAMTRPIEGLVGKVNRPPA